MESVACDYCGSTESVQIARQTDLLHRTTDEFFDIVQCTSCGLQYTNPRPESAEIGRYYAKGYSFHAARSKLRRVIAAVSERVANGPLAAFAGLLPGISRRLAMHVKPSITDPVRDYYASGGVGTMLDIGCGTGASAHFWGERGALLAYRQITEVAGVEVADRARELLAGEGVEAWRDIGDVPRDRRFGLIRMNWSLEHVYSPLRYFSFIRDRLETNGRAVITVPNYDGLIYRLAPDCVELPIHLYHFRPCDIENFADRCGLRVLELRTFSYSQMFIAAAQAGLFPGSFSKQLNVWQARTFQSVLTRFDRAGWGNDMIAVLGPVR